MRIRSITPVLASVSLIAWIGTSLYLAPASASDCTPTQTTYDTGTTIYTVLQFSNTGTCNWQSPAGVTQADVLLVAGGGGGGSRIGGGGGGGEVRFIENQSVTPSTTYSVVVGAGGNGGTVDASANGSTGSNGGSSSIFGTTVAGGGGGGSLGGTTAAAGKSGGSGGGGSCASGNNFGASSKLGSGLGNDGGLGFNGGGSACVAGGGGGAGAAGSAANGTTQSGGAGGNGSSFSITSTSFTLYGGGGGGGINAGTGAISAGNPGAGGNGGGGAGGPKNTASGPVNGLPGTDGLGGGGGGASNHYGTFTAATSGLGGKGGSGIVIVRYIAPPNFSENTNAVLLVDPRSFSSAIPFVNLSSSAPSRICFDLYTNNAKTTGLDLKDHRYADSSSFRLSRDDGASALTSVLQEDDSKSSKKGMRIQGTKENVNSLLKRSQVTDPGYIRIHKSDDGWVDGSVLEIRADYGVDNPCSSTSSTEVTTQVLIKVVGIQVNQKNEVSVN